MQLFKYLLVLALLMSCVFAEEVATEQATEQTEKPVELKAKLLLEKKVDSEYPGLYAPGQNITITVNVFNAGNGAATNVNVEDSWSAEQFTVFGETSAKFDEIAAGQLVSYKFTVTPVQEGDIQGFTAKATYLASADATETKTVVSTFMRPMKVVSAELYHKYVGSNVVTFSVFGFFSLGSVFGPLAYYYLAAQEKSKTA